LSIYFYLRSEREPSLSSRFYLLSLLAFLLALLSKTTSVMLPVVLLGCAWWQRGSLLRRDWLRTSPYFVLAIGFGVMSVWFQTHQAFTTATVQTENFWGRLAGAGLAFWFYLGKALFPFHLNMIYPRWVIDTAAPMSYLPLALASVLFGVCWVFRRSWGRHVLFGLGYFAVTLFPALGFFDFYYLAISRVSDHLQYLSLIGVVALVAALAKRTLPRVVLQFTGAAVVLFLGFLTLQRAQVLAKDETLWRDVLAKNPASWTAHNNLGCILAERNKLGEAILQFIESLRANPQNAQAHCNLGKAFSVQNSFPEAEAQFRIALRLNPANADIHKSFASVLIEQGKNQEALTHLTEALRLDPDAETRLELARLLHQLGRFRETADQYRAVLVLKPDLLEALNNLAWVLATCPDAKVRNGSEAVHFAERACQLTHYKEVMPLGSLAAAYAEAGRFSDAIKAAEKSLQLAEAAGDAQSAGINRELLKLYRAGRPYHEPLPNPKSK
jgi:tetratricopeptide (TPR) repeat protein